MPKVRESSPYRLYNEDCFETFKRIPDGSVDMVLCDLPYGTTACKWDAVIPFEPLWREYRRVCKPNAAIVLTASQPFTTALIASNMQDFRYCWVWDKVIPGGFNYARFQPMRQHEDIVVFYQQPPTYDPKGEVYNIPLKYKPARSASDSSHMTHTMSRDDVLTATHRNKRSILQFLKVVQGDHPTQKPFALMQYLVKTYTVEGDTVLDNCMGSGTTGVACAHTGRKFIGCDSDTEHGYFDIAETRIKVAYHQAAAKSRKS